MIVRAGECRRQLEDTVNDDPDIKALRLTPNDWRELSDIKKILARFKKYTEYVSRHSPSLHMAARMFGELRSVLLDIKERRGEWQKISPAITVHVSDGISLLEKYHDCVQDNDIYYIASVLGPRIKTKWLKTLPDGEKIIHRIREFLKKAYSTTKQPYRLLQAPIGRASNIDFWKPFSLHSITSLSLTSTSTSILRQSALVLI
jgi:hypothetical protein